MYIAPRQGQTAQRGQSFNVNRNVLSLHSFVASFKKMSSKSDFMILYNYVYSLGTGADNPLTTKFWSQQEHLVTSVICCKFQKNILWITTASIWATPGGSFDASAHLLGSRTVPIFVQSSQAIDRNPSQSNYRMLKLDYPSMRVCNFPMVIPARTIQKYTWKKQNKNPSIYDLELKIAKIRSVYAWLMSDVCICNKIFKMKTVQLQKHLPSNFSPNLILAQVCIQNHPAGDMTRFS